MQKEFRPASASRLTQWILAGLQHDNVMGIPTDRIAPIDQRMSTSLMGEPLAAPLGVAAGPHTQLAQNIIAAWLFGARFIELKTVQVLDSIEVSRPCIDSADETYNCEWSQELSLDQSFQEYLHAWVIIHAIAHKLGRKPDMIFNMSVGYDLKGIKTDKVQRFIRRMRDASAELPAVIDEVAALYPGVRDIDIPSRMTQLITLSTMHGCPPSEIQSIAEHMLRDLGLNTWVKLNPTLLGPDLLRRILNERMGHDVTVEDAAFEHDPKFDEAMEMVTQLKDVAKDEHLQFGLKLSNTLEVKNHRPIFPPNEQNMYMSGHALHPLTLTLANKITEHQDGDIFLSFCGGANAFNFPNLLADGLGPVTTCSDLLKPGGYGRLTQYIENLAAALDERAANSIDDLIVSQASRIGITSSDVAGCARANLAAHASDVVMDDSLRRRPRPLKFKGKRTLGYFDCVAAPCVEACPTHQDIPNYLHKVATGDNDGALDIILHTNAMPGVTGHVCDHPCMDRCVRNLYDSPLEIRAMKRHAVTNAVSKHLPSKPKQQKTKVAILGAGPLGLTAAYYLGLAGADVTIFEQKREVGGMASGVIPSYRLPEQPIVEDIDRIKALGVRFELGVSVGKDIGAEQLRSSHDYVVLGLGAQQGRRLGITGEDAPGVHDAIEFLDAVRQGNAPQIGPTVLVVGGGNSAMDAARTAVRLVDGGSVSLVYRRTMAQMPADMEEIEACLEEGVNVRELLAPVKVVQRDGHVAELVCQQMRLEGNDDSGRPRPVPVEGSDKPLPCDTVLVAISQRAVAEFVNALGVRRNNNGTILIDEQTKETSAENIFAGGDVVRGPATIIEAIADGRRIAETIAKREGLTERAELTISKNLSRKHLLDKRSRRELPFEEPSLPVEERTGFKQVLLPYVVSEAQQEASRCLACDELCDLCVTVCPNRANQDYEVTPRSVSMPVFSVVEGELMTEDSRTFTLRQGVQIINLADFCNECGNCTTFCPTAGAPFRDKPRVHVDREGFEQAPYDAFLCEATDTGHRWEAKVGQVRHVLEVTNDRFTYRCAGLTAIFDRGSWSFVSAQWSGENQEESIISHLDLTQTCATMMVLSEGDPMAVLATG